jgi:hypothetical protein
MVAMLELTTGEDERQRCRGAKLTTRIWIHPTSAAVDERAASEIEQRQQALDLWLDCLSDVQIGNRLGVTDKTAKKWYSEFPPPGAFSDPPELRQHFDVWHLPAARIGHAKCSD